MVKILIVFAWLIGLIVIPVLPAIGGIALGRSQESCERMFRITLWLYLGATAVFILTR